jgi:hypothetical protein
VEGGDVVSPSTKTLIEALIRLAKGVIVETEKWLKAQDVQ